MIVTFIYFEFIVLNKQTTHILHCRNIIKPNRNNRKYKKLLTIKYFIMLDAISTIKIKYIEVQDMACIIKLQKHVHAVTCIKKSPFSCPVI